MRLHVEGVSVHACMWVLMNVQVYLCMQSMCVSMHLDTRGHHWPSSGANHLEFVVVVLFCLATGSVTGLAFAR